MTADDYAAPKYSLRRILVSDAVTAAKVVQLFPLAAIDVDETIPPRSMAFLVEDTFQRTAVVDAARVRR